MLAQAWLSEMMSSEEPSTSLISINRFLENTFLCLSSQRLFSSFSCVCVDDVVRSLKSSLLVCLLAVDRFIFFFLFFFKNSIIGFVCVKLCVWFISRLLIAAYVVTQTQFFVLLSLNSLMKVFHFFDILFRVVDLVLSYLVLVCYIEGAMTALNLSGTMLGFYPVKVLPSKTAIAPVNPTFLPRVKLFFFLLCKKS